MKSLEELKALRDKMQGSVTLRNESEAGTRVVVGMATCGIASGARPVLKTLLLHRPVASAYASMNRSWKYSSPAKRKLHM